MKVAVLKDIGENSSLHLVSLDTPDLQEESALVKVDYCGVNHLDILIRTGKRPGPKKFPHILGSEIIGEIAKLNSSQENFNMGNKVAVYPWTFDSTCQQCQNGYENICDHMGTIGRTSWGGYAEYILVPVKNLLKIPNDSEEDKICAGILAGTTAVHLIERANIKNNSSVLITGSTGGVGTLVLQLLKQLKCQIVCVTSHQEKANQLEELGATHVISTNNFIEEIKKLFPEGVNYVVDLVGGNIWSQAMESLGKNGTMVYCATSLNEPGIVNIGSAFSRQLNILGSYGGTLENFKEMINLVQEGVLSPVIDTVFPLEEAMKAHERVERQEVFGKILLKV